ncbi:MFS general substrate transporter [Punctularia strigosozonata HHB-11173 SS5]|uniref:MFS general substrate transporter n=1 Tax=Punctularia strigosozonata (strain HHB-11173) TaxID=741275 RepID=UPI0004418663|nr:MFS general substrate transporter [Punctularia strigosozonata HHB-11173 SS5]EIN05792.1 MFS general substrate transporter [Punctularia strigosozonata HHB-11173 SS5]
MPDGTTRNIDDGNPTEATALLAGIDHGLARTPLPKLQLGSLYLTKLVVPVAATQIMPYVNELVQRFEFTDNPARIGVYSGLIGSASLWAQLISTYPWGRLSDSAGRRPVILAGTAGIGIAAVMFGFSRSFAALLVARIISGLFAGNVATMHSVVGELTDATNQSIAFPVYDLCSALGFVVGPLVGGLLANPGERWIMFSSKLWKTYPYALPCLATAALATLALLAGSLILKETLPAKRSAEHKQSLDAVESSIVDAPDPEVLFVEARADALQPPTTRELLTHPPLRAVLIAGVVMAFLASAFNAVFVLFCYTPVRIGGLGFSPSEIGRALAISGSTSAVMKLFLMPYLLQRFHILSLYTFTLRTWPITFLLFPLLNYIAQESAGAHTALLWAAVTLVAVMSRIGTLAFSISMILVRETAPGAASLGASNAFAEISQSLAIGISPVFVSWIFGLSIEARAFNGYGWTGVMALIGLSGSWFVRRIGVAQRVHAQGLVE